MLEVENERLELEKKKLEVKLDLEIKKRESLQARYEQSLKNIAGMKNSF